MHSRCNCENRLVKWLVALALAWLIFLVASIAHGVVPPMPADPLMAPTTSCPTTSSTQLLCLTNYARRKAGLVPVKGSASLYASAKLKTQRIVECRQISHTPCGDVNKLPPGFMYWGENLAGGYTTIRGAFRGWLGSAPHRANLLKPAYRLFGSSRISFTVFPGSPVWILQLGS